MNVKVSVIMPFYNCENFLKYSIESILNQTFTDFEFIIINDGSTDNSDSIINKYINLDKRIKYIKNKKNKGIVYNLNNALNLAKGEYIVRMDGDDISLKERIEKQVSYLDKNPNIAILGGKVELIDENYKSIGFINKPLKHLDIKKDIFLYSPFIHPSVCYRKEIVLKFLYREEYLYVEDYDLWLRVINSGHKGANLDSIILKYRKHRFSTNNNGKEITKKNFLLRKEIIKNYGYRPGLLGYLAMYSHLYLGLVISGSKKEKVEKFIKKIIVKND